MIFLYFHIILIKLLIFLQVLKFQLILSTHLRVTMVYCPNNNELAKYSHSLRLLCSACAWLITYSMLPYHTLTSFMIWKCFHPKDVSKSAIIKAVNLCVTISLAFGGEGLFDLRDYISALPPYLSLFQYLVCSSCVYSFVLVMLPVSFTTAYSSFPFSLFIFFSLKMFIYNVYFASEFVFVLWLLCHCSHCQVLFICFLPHFCVVFTTIHCFISLVLPEHPLKLPLSRLRRCWMYFIIC